MPVVAAAVVELRSPLASYGPGVWEGYLDSTSLHASLVAVEAEVLGEQRPLLRDVRVTSLLPCLEAGDGCLPLAPPARLGSLSQTASSSWWTLAALEEAAAAAAGCGGSVVLEEAVDGGGGGRRVVELRCYGSDGPGERVGELAACRLGGGWLVSAPYAGRLLPEGVGLPSRGPMVVERIVNDRVTAAATPYRLPPALRPGLYWFAAVVDGDEQLKRLRAVLHAAEHVGLGAYRSVGYGRLRLRGLAAGEVEASGGGACVSLGLLLPAEAGSCSIYGGSVAVYGGFRGYGGRVVNFIRPRVRALTVGSVVSQGCRGRVVESGSEAPAPYVYSFNPVMVPCDAHARLLEDLVSRAYRGEG